MEKLRNSLEMVFILIEKDKNLCIHIYGIYFIFLRLSSKKFNANLRIIEIVFTRRIHQKVYDSAVSYRIFKTCSTK